MIEKLSKKTRRCVSFFLIISVLQMLLEMPIFSQDDKSEVKKYTIREYLEANLPPQEGRQIVLDEIIGLLTITDTPKNQELALQLIREWDIGPKQILIEAKFIEITFTDLDEIGVDWEMLRTDAPIIANFTGNAATGTDALSTGTGMMGTGTSAAAFASAASTAGLGLVVGRALISGNTLLAYLKALAQSGKVDLLNAPRITTLSGQMANLQVVRSFPYATSVERTQVDLSGSTAGTTSSIFPVETYEIEEETTGITLEVMPTVIEGSNIITLEIHPEVTRLVQQIALSSLTQISGTTAIFPPNLGWPIIDTRTAQTTVMIRSGETIVIGGLIQDQDSNTINRKIPFLGDIPFIGNLFRYKYEERAKKNLVVFITAKLIGTHGEEIR